jgi:predicted CXXCH cytochrome family protein
MADLFAKSPHARAFAQMGVPGCATCHDNHAIKAASDEMVGAVEPAVCAGCHSPTDAGGKAAAAMRASLEALRTDLGRASDLLRHAEEAGMEVSQARFDLNGGNDALVKARAMVHAANVDVVKTEIDAGTTIAGKAYDRGVRALEELRFRRAGLVVSLVIVLALIAGLVLKIRQIERRPGRATGDTVEEHHG